MSMVPPAAEGSRVKVPWGKINVPPIAICVPDNA